MHVLCFHSDLSDMNLFIRCMSVGKCLNPKFLSVHNLSA